LPFTSRRRFPEFPRSNELMVEDLTRNRVLRSSECVAAFKAVDRQHFWIENSTEFTYADVPLRHGRLHLSAPQIYAEALESLMPLTPGMSFLNIGSGTGYFNSLVSESIGELSTNHGIDIWQETVDHAINCCKTLGKSSINFSVGNVYQLDINETMRYDRIYLGACANSRSKYLYRLLEVGGILVGPFQVGHMQQLRRVVRQTETEFNVEVLESVRFASLVEPQQAVPLDGPALQRTGADRRRSSLGSTIDDNRVGLPGIPFTFALQDRPWTPERAQVFPVSFRRAVETLLFSRPLAGDRCFLPREIWVEHVLPWCSKWWFEVPKLAPHAIKAELFEEKAHCKAIGVETEVDCDVSEDGGSTRVPSTVTSPESGLSQSPPQFEEEEPLDLGGSLLFEVFGNGRRHAIGSEDDPDDMFSIEPRHGLPVQMLQFLAAAANVGLEDDDEFDDAESAETGDDDEDELEPEVEFQMLAEAESATEVADQHDALSELSDSALLTVLDQSQDVL